MAYFVISEKMKDTWKFLTPIKIDVRTESGRLELEELEGSNEFVSEVPYTNLTNKCHALVEGKFFAINKLANLKYLLVKYAVENNMEAKELTKLLKPRKSKARKEFLISVGGITS